MKRIIAFSVLTILSIMMLVSCSTAYSSDYYDEISSYVKTNADYISTSEDIEYFHYSETASTETKSYYGYYYTKNGGLHPYVADGMVLSSAVESKDGGYYYGDVSDESDWCFVKAITPNWFYFETHDYIFN